MRSAAFAFAVAAWLALPWPAALADLVLMTLTLGVLRYWLDEGASS